MDSFGELFRMYRVDKGYKLSYVAEGIVTPQFLRKFEKDESDITITKFFALLDRINVSMEEFTYEYSEYTQKTTLEKIEERLDSIIIYRDKKTCNQWLADLSAEKEGILGIHEEFTGYLKILLKIFSNRIFGSDYQIDIKKIVHYLESVETWGSYEFFLGNYSCSAMDKEAISSLWFQAFSKKIKSPSIRRYSQDFYLHVCQALLLKKEVALAKQMLIDYEKWQNPEKILQNLSFATLGNILRGTIMICEGDSTGVAICQKNLDFFYQQVGFYDYADRMKDMIYQITGKKL